MKRTVFLFALFLTGLAGVTAGENGLNLIPVPDRLFRSMSPAIISGADNGFELPAQVDIGSSVLIARSQGGLGSCASWAVASELTRFERIRNNWPVGKNISFFSPLYLYNQVNGGLDRGGSLYNNLNILVNNGCSLMVTFPYEENYRIQPPVSAHREAARYRIDDFKPLSVNLDTIKQALAKGYGVIVSFHVYDNFDSYSGGIYRPGGPSGVKRGADRFDYHGMLIVGYNDADRLIKILNSWGTSWGDNGYMYISYDDLSALISEAYIMIPKNSLPTTAVAPSRVQAGKGANRNKIIISWEKNGTGEYEIFRLGENESYNSIGKTSGNFFEDTAVVPNQHYFYFVAAHKGDYMSELSLAAEGWISENAAEVPGIPSAFSVRRQGDTIIAQWQAVENASLYQVYLFDDSLGEYVLIGETAGTVFSTPIPARITSPVMTFFVLAKNHSGQGLPSEPAAIVIAEFRKTDNQQEDDITEGQNEVYKGNFYHFPFELFNAAEKAAMEYFKNQREEFSQRFRFNKDQAAAHFRRQRDVYQNRLQNENEHFRGGR